MKERSATPKTLAGTEDDEQVLWMAMSRGVEDARLELIERYMPLAERIARQQFAKRRGGDLDLRDMIQMACVGLVEAVGRFDLHRFVPFSAFATPRILGSISDGLSHISEAREQLSWRRRRQKERMQSLKRQSTAKRDPLEELADVAIGLAIGFLLEETGMIMDDRRIHTLTAFDSAAWNETVTKLENAVAALPARDRLLLNCHYQQDMRFDDIAKIFGVSNARVSQLHGAALEVLKKKMAAAGHFAGRL